MPYRLKIYALRLGVHQIRAMYSSVNMMVNTHSSCRNRLPYLTSRLVMESSMITATLAIMIAIRERSNHFPAGVSVPKIIS